MPQADTDSSRSRRPRRLSAPELTVSRHDPWLP